MTPHPATKQQVMRAGEKPGREDEVRSQPCLECAQVYPTPATAGRPGKSFPSHVLGKKNAQGQTLSIQSLLSSSSAPG